MEKVPIIPLYTREGWKMAQRDSTTQLKPSYTEVYNEFEKYKRAIKDLDAMIASLVAAKWK